MGVAGSQAAARKISCWLSVTVRPSCYGRAARILDMMQRDGIIGPPDGSKPREVLKRPDWLKEVESHLK